MLLSDQLVFIYAGLERGPAKASHWNLVLSKCCSHPSLAVLLLMA